MIHVSHLVKKFGNFTAVNDISFEVRAGEIFAFLGPNGAGKTTTIKMLTKSPSSTTAGSSSGAPPKSSRKKPRPLGGATVAMFQGLAVFLIALLIGFRVQNFLSFR